jgi:hypothetical protein
MNVWVFAEERSGSTCFCSALSNHLKLPFEFTEQYKSTDQSIYQTHNFALLKEIDGVVLRTTRHNHLEQFLSYIFAERTEWAVAFIHKTNGAKRRERFEALKAEQITVTKAEVHAWVKLKRERQTLWDGYKGPKQTVVYEDLLDGVAIPALQIDQIRLSDGGFEKLPYAKEQCFTNVDQIRMWLINNDMSISQSQVEELAKYKAGTAIGHQLTVNDCDRFEAFKELFLRQEFDKWKSSLVGPLENK